MISPHFPRGSKITRQVACKKIASCKQVLHGRALFCFFVFVFVSAFFFFFLFGGGGGSVKRCQGSRSIVLLLHAVSLV